VCATSDDQIDRAGRRRAVGLLSIIDHRVNGVLATTRLLENASSTGAAFTGGHSMDRRPAPVGSHDRWPRPALRRQHLRHNHVQNCLRNLEVIEASGASRFGFMGDHAAVWNR